MTFFTLYHGINPPLKTTNLGEYVLELFPSIKQSQIQGLQTEEKHNLCFTKWGKKNWGWLQNKVHPNYHKIPFLYSFATVVISGGAEISYDNHPSTPRLKSSPWRARVARAPKAQAVARGDLLGNLLKIHQGLWYDP